jgi:hypothetical protein
MMQLQGLCYLAAPYSSSCSAVIEQRMEQVSRAQAHLIKQGLLVVTPLSAHYLLKYENLPGNWAYWKRQSIAMLRVCNSLILLPLPGWQESIGVTAELELARQLDMPCYQCDVNNYSLERF